MRSGLAASTREVGSVHLGIEVHWGCDSMKWEQCRSPHSPEVH